MSNKQGLSFRIKILLFFLGLSLLALGGFSAFIYLHREPSYQGRTLTQWISDLGDQNVAVRIGATNAIREIGTNAIPVLIRWFQSTSQPHPLQENLEKVSDWLNDHANVNLNIPTRKDFGPQEAALIFRILGSQAQAGIPKLETLLENEPVGMFAADSLASFGMISYPTLTNALSSTNSVVRGNALYALAEIGINASNAAPVIANLASDTNPFVARRAICALGELATPQSKYAFELTEMLRTNHQADISAMALRRSGVVLPLLAGMTNDSWTIRWCCMQGLHTKPKTETIINSLDFYVRTKGPSIDFPQPAPNRPLPNWNRMAITVIIAYLKNPDDQVRAAAADVLKTFGVTAYRAVPDLMAALSDDSASVRQSAAEALKSIDVQFVEGGIIRGPKKQKKIALEFTGHTFAEGGETILDELAKHHAKASFFLTGDFMTNPAFLTLISRIQKEGHYLGTHSKKHLLYCSWESHKKTLVSQYQFEADMDALSPGSTMSMRRYRLKSQGPFWVPPYEHYNQEIADWSKALHLSLVNYTPGTRSNADYTQESDTNFVSSQAILDSILKKEREDPDGLNGFLLLMHLGAGPGRKDKMHARFGELLDALSAKGYQFVRIDELLGAKQD